MILIYLTLVLSIFVLYQQTNNVVFAHSQKSQSQSRNLILSSSQSQSQILRPEYQSLSLSLKNWDSNPKYQSQSQNLIPRGESLSLSLKNWYHYQKSQSQSHFLRLSLLSLSLSLNVKNLVSHIPVIRRLNFLPKILLAFFLTKKIILYR